MPANPPFLLPLSHGRFLSHPMLAFAPQVGNEPLPKASGWVPKDVIRLAQAFKHSNRIKTEWK